MRHRHRIRCSLLWIVLVVVLALAQPALAQDAPGDAGNTGITVHIVQPDESLADIALLYGTTVETIQQINGLTSPEDIQIGQRLIIPETDIVAEPVPSTVIVGAADTFYGLATRYAVTPERLGRLNHIVNPTALYVGLSLNIPTATQPDGSKQPGLMRLHEGETLWHLALRSNNNVVALMLRNGISNPLLIIPGSLLLVPGASNQPVLPAPWVSVTLHPIPLETGRSGSLRIETQTAGTIRGNFLSTELIFVSEGTTHQALLGVDRWTAPGLYPLSLVFEDGRGGIWQFNREVLIIDGGYGSETIRLPAEIVAILNNAQIVQGENSYIAEKMSGFTPERYWDHLFLLPAAGVMSSAFGTARSYSNSNGLYTFHTGADFAAPTGTPIYAPADGVVVDTGYLDIRGLVTIIDHGWGVYTGYWHQSSTLVEPGDPVVAGQQIGTIGNTGLSTAAHLHWEMWVRGVQVDPLQWVREPFP